MEAYYVTWECLEISVSIKTMIALKTLRKNLIPHWIISGYLPKQAKHLQCHYVDPRRFGRLGVWIENNNKNHNRNKNLIEKKLSTVNNHPFLAHLGVEPLDQQISKTKLAKLLNSCAKNRSLSIKSFIMDSKVIVGIGNIYACESLFSAKIKPTRSAGSLTFNEFNRLSNSIINTLDKAIKYGGSTIRDFNSSLGHKGMFPLYADVYDRKDQQCKICGTKIIKISQHNRSTYYCKKCQK